MKTTTTTDKLTFADAKQRVLSSYYDSLDLGKDEEQGGGYHRVASTTYRIDFDALTVIATGKDGESYDLNAVGEPCVTVADLCDFVAELHEQGAFDATTRDELLSDVEASA